MARTLAMKGLSSLVFILAVILHGSFTLASLSEMPRLRVAEIRSSINPATSQYLKHAIHLAEQEGAEALIVELDTPGGLITSVREMTQAVSQSKVPVVVYVTPSGASATSAGALLMLSSHLAVMAPGSNIGAAHPVGSQGEDVKGVMGEKVLNDTVAFAKSLAETRGRNIDIAEKVVSKSASYTADEALKLKLIDQVSGSRADLIASLNQRVVKMPDNQEKVIRSESAVIEITEMSWGLKLLNLLANPNLSAILMTLGMILIYFEASHPGGFFPGIAGIICLLAAFMALQALPIRTGGLALVGLGVVLMLAEPFVTSKGALAAGGGISFILGLLWVVDPEKSDLTVSWSVLFPAALGLALGIGTVAWAAARTLRLSREAMLKIGGGALSGLSGYEAQVEGVDPGGLTGTVSIRGEIWRFSADRPVQVGDHASVSHVEGMKVFIQTFSK